MNLFIAMAVFVGTWLLVRPILLRYRRYRRRSPGGREWQEYKARLPGWVKQTEMIFQITFWLGLAYLLFRAFLSIHIWFHSPAGKSAGVGFGVELFASLFAALVPAMLLANIISWLTPPLRRANLVAFEGLETASYRSAMIGLAKFGAILTPVAFVIGSVAAYEPWLR